MVTENSISLVAVAVAHSVNTITWFHDTHFFYCCYNCFRCHCCHEWVLYGNNTKIMKSMPLPSQCQQVFTAHSHCGDNNIFIIILVSSWNGFEPFCNDNGNRKNGYPDNRWWCSHCDGSGKQKRFYLTCRHSVNEPLLCEHLHLVQ